MPLTVATANVNGLRAAARKDMAGWVRTAGADVVTLQEVRAPDDLVGQLVAEVFGPDWHVAHSEATAKGRAGVAVVSRLPFSRTHDAAEQPCFDGTGRWIETDIALPDGTTLTVVAAYAFTGDLNVAHRDSDLKNWKGNVGKAGCHPDERARFDRWTDDLGWVDVARALADDPDRVPYTWWSYRGRAFDTDAGWRIDYQFATPELAARATTARVDRAAAYDQRWSDHAPVVVTYDV